MLVVLIETEMVKKLSSKPDIFRQNWTFISVGGRDAIDLFDIALDGDKPEKDSDSEITHSMNFTDPMDPEYCCDDPKECLCTFGCVGIV